MTVATKVNKSVDISEMLCVVVDQISEDSLCKYTLLHVGFHRDMHLAGYFESVSEENRVGGRL